MHTENSIVNRRRNRHRRGWDRKESRRVEKCSTKTRPRVCGGTYVCWGVQVDGYRHSQQETRAFKQTHGRVPRFHCEATLEHSNGSRRRRVPTPRPHASAPPPAPHWLPTPRNVAASERLGNIPNSVSNQYSLNKQCGA